MAVLVLKYHCHGHCDAQLWDVGYISRRVDMPVLILGFEIPQKTNLQFWESKPVRTYLSEALP